MKKFKQTLKLIGIYLGMCLAVSIIAGIAWIIYYKNIHPDASIRTACESVPNLLEMLLTDAGTIAAVVIAWKQKLIRLPECLKMSKNQWSKAALPLALGISWFACTIFIDDLSNIKPDEDVVNILKECMHSVIGCLSICIIGPILEELIMREGVLGTMLRNKVNPWAAIVISSVIFGAIHFNLWQMVSAIIGGVVLGVLYWKSGNIVLPAIIHIANNTTSTVISLMTEDMPDDIKVYDFLGGKSVGIVLCGVFAILSAVLLIKYLKTEDATVEE